MHSSSLRTATLSWMVRAFGLLLVLSAIGLLVVSRDQASAGVIDLVVDTTADNAALTACTAATGDCSLRGAISSANLNGGLDTITFATATNGTPFTLTIGGIENLNAAGDLDVLDDVTITGNGAANTVVRACDDGTGATVCTGIDRVFHILSNASVEVSGATIRRGTSPSSGAGILKTGSGTLTISNSAISGNTALDGGGIYASSGTTNVSASTISSNTASGGGGGIYASSGTTNVSASTISSNEANADGGGIYNEASGTFVISNSTISSNGSRSSSNGGGIFNAGTVTFGESTISGNTAAGGGGGIHHASGSARIKNTIVANNNATGPPDCEGTITSAGYNLIENTTACAIGGDTTGNITGTDPNLGALALNAPGTTQTHKPNAGSPVIDAGTNTGCPATDQRGLSRPADGNGDFVGVCEMGAVEIGPDLVITNISHSPPVPEPGQTVDVSVTVQNQGDAVAASFYIDIYRHSETPPGDFYGDPFCGAFLNVAPGTAVVCDGSNQSGTPVSYAAPGDYQLWARVDAFDNFTKETNESNNVGGPHAISVVGVPDLVIDSIVLTPPSPVENQFVDVTVNYRNQGTAIAENVSTGFYVDFYMDLPFPPGSQFGDFFCQSFALAAGDTATCMGSVAYSPAGMYNMWAQIDLDGNITESNEGNNVFGPQPVDVLPDYDGDAVADPSDNCPAWYNPAQNVPPWTVPPGDSDCDGFTDAAEGTLGTDPLDQCPDNATDDAWPPDINMTGGVSVTDVLFLKPWFNQSVPPAPARYDLVPTSPPTAVNITDVVEFKKYFGLNCA